MPTAYIGYVMYSIVKSRFCHTLHNEKVCKIFNTNEVDKLTSTQKLLYLSHDNRTGVLRRTTFQAGEFGSVLL